MFSSSCLSNFPVNVQLPSGPFSKISRNAPSNTFLSTAISSLNLSGVIPCMSWRSKHTELCTNMCCMHGCLLSSLARGTYVPSEKAAWTLPPSALSTLQAQKRITQISNGIDVAWWIGDSDAVARNSDVHQQVPPVFTKYSIYSPLGAQQASALFATGPASCPKCSGLSSPACVTYLRPSPFLQPRPHHATTPLQA